MTEADIDRALDQDDEEVTAVTQLVDSVVRVGKSCEVAVEETVEKARAVQRSLTPPELMPAVHVHVPECWDAPGELSSRCPERKEEPATKT